MRQRLIVWITVCALLASLVLAHEPVVGTLSDPSVPIEVLSINSSSSIRPCEVASFAFALHNRGDVTDKIDLGADPFADNAFFSENPIILRAGEEREVALFIAPPCEQFGTYNVELLAKSGLLGSQVETLIGSLEIIPDGIIEIAPGVKRIRVDYNASGVSIPVKNIGGIDVEYEISIDGPSWLSIKPKSIQLAAGEKASLEVISSPPTTVEKGTYRLTIFAKAMETDVEYGKVVEVVLAPFSQDELASQSRKPLIIWALVIAGVLILILIIVLIYLVRTKESRALARDARRQERDEARARKEEERRLRDAQREAQRRSRGDAVKEGFASRMRRFLAGEILAENFIVSPEGNIHRRWLARLAWAVIALFVLALMGWLVYAFWPLIEPYWFELVIVVAAVILIVLIAMGIRMFERRRWRGQFSSKEIDGFREQAKADLRKNGFLLSKDRWSQARSPFSWVPVIVFIVLGILALVLAGVAYFMPVIFGDLWRELFVAGLVFALIFIILLVLLWWIRRARFKRAVIPSMKPGRECSVGTGWRDGLSEVSLCLKKEGEGIVMMFRRHPESPAFVPPEGVAYQFVEIRSPGLNDKDVESLGVKFRVRRRWLGKKHCLEGDVSLMRYDPVKSRWVRAKDLDIVSQDDSFVSYSAESTGLGYFAIVARARGEEEHLARAGASGVDAADKALRDSARESAREKEWERSLERRKGSALSLEEEIAARQAERESARLAALASKKADQKRKASSEIDELLRGQDKKSMSFWKIAAWILLILLLFAVIVAAVWYVDPSLMPPALASWLGLDQGGRVNPPARPPVAPPVQPPVVSQPSNGSGQSSAPVTAQIGIPDQVWIQGGSHSLDLSRYFSDPDGDTLAFSNAPLKSILVGYNGSVATMTSLPDFIGEETTVFSAADTSGAAARSNSVRLVVQPGPKSDGDKVLDFLREYMVYIVASLIALAVIIISIVMLRKNDGAGGDGEEEE